MSSQTLQTMPFSQIIAFKGYLGNLGKPLNSTLKVCRHLYVSLNNPPTLSRQIKQFISEVRICTLESKDIAAHLKWNSVMKCLICRESVSTYHHSFLTEDRTSVKVL